MQRFDSDGVTLSFLDEGAGDPILLIHGFASNSTVNWRNTNWVKTLIGAGFRVIAFDNRGHGQSEKLYDPAQYGAPTMAEDALRLLDHLGIERADVMGFSMGARIAAFLTLAHPERVRSAIFAGLGINMVRGVGAPEPIAAALEAPNAEDVKNDAARSFRVFAEQTRSDRRALAACIRSSRDKIAAEELAKISRPILIAVGTDDVIAGSGPELAAIIPGAEFLEIVGRDHMKSVGDLSYKKGVLDFLSRRH
ncbi:MULTISPECIES: alpha/beta hydrolase [Rhodomicrobium]|uniref:alpha/beta fold hydrolase n=1 Tax=Rhodomicrobium TaxID=1068 RepID=UPI000B4ACA07|nr:MULTISPECIES: alpha/beta hydrolase [Rhodomicrobium]